MRKLTLIGLVVLLAAVPIQAQTPRWSFLAEFTVGFVAGVVIEGAALDLFSLVQQLPDSGLAYKLGGLAGVPLVFGFPLAVGAAVAFTGSLFGVAGNIPLAVLGAYVATPVAFVVALLAEHSWEVRWLAVPSFAAIVALAATCGLNLNSVWSR